MRSACLLQDLMGNQSGTVCGNTLSNTLSHFRSHEGGHLHSYWARRSDVLGLSSHIQIYVHKGLYNTNLCAQRLVYISSDEAYPTLRIILPLPPHHHQLFHHHPPHHQLFHRLPPHHHQLFHHRPPHPHQLFHHRPPTYAF